MKQERRKVLEMLADGCINSEEAQLLLNTLDELQVESKLTQSDTMWDFLLDLRGLMMIAKEYGRIPQPTPPLNPIQHGRAHH